MVHSPSRKDRAPENVSGAAGSVTTEEQLVCSDGTSPDASGLCADGSQPQAQGQELQRT